MAQFPCSSKIAVHSIASTYAGTSPFAGLPTVLSLIALQYAKTKRRSSLSREWVAQRGKGSIALRAHAFFVLKQVRYVLRFASLRNFSAGQETTRPEARFFDQGPLPPRKIKRHSRDTNIGLSRFETPGPEVIWTLPKISGSPRGRSIRTPGQSSTEVLGPPVL